MKTLSKASVSSYISKEEQAAGNHEGRTERGETQQSMTQLMQSIRVRNRTRNSKTWLDRQGACS